MYKMVNKKVSKLLIFNSITLRKYNI